MKYVYHVNNENTLTFSSMEFVPQYIELEKVIFDKHVEAMQNGYHVFVDDSGNLQISEKPQITLFQPIMPEQFAQSEQPVKKKTKSKTKSKGK